MLRWRGSSRFAGSGVRFPGVLGFDEGFQVVQACGPETAVLVDPGINRAQRLGIQLVDTVAALALLTDQMRAAQQAQVLGDSWTGDGKGAGDLPGGLPAATEKIEDGTASGIGECLKGGLGDFSRRNTRLRTSGLCGSA